MSKRIPAFLLAIIMLFSFGCTPPQAEPPVETTPSAPEDSTPTSFDEPTSPDENDTVYNIIFALATIPPVLAALDSIESGCETYAIIERGKTYSGIESLEYFHNVGFDPANNLSTGFTNTEFNAMVEKVKELKGENVFFNFRVQDGTALRGAAIAANAGLTADEFHIYMYEDGTGAYNALRDTYIKGNTVTADKDGAYEAYAAKVAAAKAEFDTVMSKTDNKNLDTALGYNIGKAFALAALPNFTYCIQDEGAIVGILEETGDVKTKLLSCFSADGYNFAVGYRLNLKYRKISEGIKELTEEQKTDYLTLMYGQYYADTYAALTRTERADKAAPDKKLVFIGSRHGGYPKFASDAKYGIGGISGKVPASYAELDEKYKSPLLFETEADYAAFLAVLNNAENYTEQLSPEVKNSVQVACFNLYIDYIFNLKFTYILYGEDYDIIMKGHPREVIGAYGEWGSRYKVTYKDEAGADKTYVYDKLLDNALLSFHASDSVGKYIGMVPYGTAAENLAYLGANISIAGLPSSTYSGYDTDVDVLFILAETNEAIDGDYSQVKKRYEDGNLTYTDKDGNVNTTVYYNTGNVFKYLSQELDGDAAALYLDLYLDWMQSVHGSNNEKDRLTDQGFFQSRGK